MKKWYNKKSMTIKRSYAIVDLEATSAASNAKIIQVGIVIVENGVITKTYETDVNPHQKLDQHIIDLTGLTDERLSQAPDFTQVAREIYELISDKIFVAHNVKFDANLLAEELFWAGYELRNPRLDTVELAQVFFPSLDRYGLDQLAQDLNLKLDHAHSAISDALATAQLFLLLADKIASLPAPLLSHLIALSSSVIYESDLLLKDVYESTNFGERQDLTLVEGLYLKKDFLYKEARKFSQDFESNLHLLGMSPRPNQALFAQEVEEALNRNQATFIEGETGMGKTYAYLLALLAKSQDQIIVAVPTKLLQDQIYTGEAERISQLFHINCHKLKSPNSYLSLDKFYQVLDQDMGNRLWERAKMQILVWLTETSSGDLDELGQAYRYQAFLDRLRHDGQLSNFSPFYDLDFWYRGQVKAKASRILIVNQAYLLSRLTDDPEFVRGKILLVDEAQKLFASLESLARKSLSLHQLYRQIMDEKEGADLLDQRILESIQFELQNIEENYYLTKESQIQKEDLAKLRQDLAELNPSLQLELRKAVKSFDQAWLREEELSEKNQLLLETAKLDLMNFYDLLPDQTRVLMISATLEISKRVNLASLLGFPEWHFVQIPKESQRQQVLLLDREMPDVSLLSQDVYADLICQRLQLLSQLKKPIVVLFTSKDLLLAVSEKLSLPHLAQFRNGSASNVKRRFDRAEAGILLGTGSFWEGSDFIQQDQVIQVITRLPFDNPQDPFVQKINHHLMMEKKNPFYDYSLPLAILRLKQALGRTRRREDQESAVLFLDSRILSKPYSRQIRQALSSQASLLEVGEEDLLMSLEEFFNKHSQE